MLISHDKLIANVSKLLIESLKLKISNITITFDESSKILVLQKNIVKKKNWRYMENM